MPHTQTGEVNIEEGVQTAVMTEWIISTLKYGRYENFTRVIVTLNIF